MKQYFLIIHCFATILLSYSSSVHVYNHLSNHRMTTVDYDETINNIVSSIHNWKNNFFRRLIENSVFKGGIANGNSTLDGKEFNSITNDANFDTTISSSRIPTFPEQGRPFITISYAQTLDGMIASKRDKSEEIGSSLFSSNLKISCPESLVLTHALRSTHDAILIGGNTVLIDNPRLTNRLWKNSCDNHSLSHDGTISDTTAKTSEQGERYEYRQPTPIILDTTLRHLIKMIRESVNIRVLSCGDHSRCIICCTKDSWNKHEKELCEYFMNQSNAKDICQIEKNGMYTCFFNSTRVDFLPCEINDENVLDNSLQSASLDLKNVLNNLYMKCGIKSVMVEGGSSILSSFLSFREKNNGDLVDCLCVTIAPKMMGSLNGVHVLKDVNLIGSCKSLNSEEDNSDNIGGLNTNSLFDFHGKSKSSSSRWIIVGSDCIYLSSNYD